MWVLWVAGGFVAWTVVAGLLAVLVGKLIRLADVGDHPYRRGRRSDTCRHSERTGCPGRCGPSGQVPSTDSNGSLV
jgi:hypothetical protein